jgi:hypothetical protein
MAHIADAADVAVQNRLLHVPHQGLPCSAAPTTTRSRVEGEPILPWEQPWYREMVAAADVVESLGQLVSGVGEITRGLRPCMSWLQALPRATRRSLRWSIATSGGASRGTGAWSRCWRSKSALTAGLTPERANDLLLLYVGMDVYHALVEVAGWSHDAWAAWTRATLAHQLFAVEIDDL